MLPRFPLAPQKSILKRAWLRSWTQFLCILDPFSGWVIPSFFKGLKVIRKHQIDTMVVTGPPFSQVFTALLLSKICRIKLIIDYQDPWTTNSWDIRAKYGNLFFKQINHILEKWAVISAKEIVVCSYKMKEQFEKSFGKYTSVDCHVIHNGYINNNKVPANKLGQNRKNLVYAGDLYGERKIRLVAEPLIQLIAEDVLCKEEYCLHIFGRLNSEDVQFIKDNALEDIIIEHSPIPYNKIIGYLKAADILVLISGYVMDYSISYKFYDYLSVRKPILAIVPENSEMDILFKEVDCGEVGYINDCESIQNALKKLLLKKYSYTFKGAEKFSWEIAAKKYYRVVNNHP